MDKQIDERIPRPYQTDPIVNEKQVFLIIGFILYSVIIGSLSFTWGQMNKTGKQNNADMTDQITPPSDEVVCTTDAKLCPDGSAVGRVGARCDFAPCPTSTTTLHKNNCALNKRANVDALMKAYTVQDGDTLESVVRNQLGDLSRIQEFAVLNADKYPSLFKSAGIVDIDAKLIPGWIMLYPPEWITESSGQLDIINGMILRIRPEDESMVISSSSDQSGHYATITAENSTLNSNRTQFKSGDCITAVRDIRMNKILKIDLQTVLR